MGVNEPIIGRIADLMSRQEVAVFLGPDLPAVATGIPGWTGLAARLAERNGFPAGKLWPETAARYAQNSGRRELVDWLDGQITTKTIGPLYPMLSRLPVETYISTTYDAQLSIALTRAGRPANVIISDADLSFIRTTHTTVVKLLGELGPGGRESLLLTSSDIRGMLRTRTAILEQALRPAFTGQSLLILGQDPNADLFRTLYYWALPQNSPLRRRAFAIWPGMANWEKESWRQDELVVIEDNVMPFLALLATHLESKGIDLQAKVEAKPDSTYQNMQPTATPSPEETGKVPPAQLPLDDEDIKATLEPAAGKESSAKEILPLPERLPQMLRSFTLASLAIILGFAVLGLVFPDQVSTLALVIVAVILTLILVIVATHLAVRILSPESGERLFQSILRALPLVGRLAGASPDTASGESGKSETEDVPPG
jgi:hypothetical protein